MYIRATGNISPQKTFGHPPFMEVLMPYAGNRLACIEPDYKAFIDVKLIRRMSRIIRMGVAAAMECLQEAGISQPDAIVTGTAYGCLEDTGSFMTRMVEFNETLLTPTAFIQSTHNTIGAQIGLLLQCHNYNNAFVHRGFSFESALLDGMMLLNENEAQTVLVGAIDEITNYSHTILTRLGLYRATNTGNLTLFAANQKGTIAGEGAAFFLLANEQSAADYARLIGLKTFYKPVDIAETEAAIARFLADHLLTMDDIDLIINGRNGDTVADTVFDLLDAGIFAQKPSASFKHLCGEYPTASSFALWMAAQILKTGSLPETVVTTTPPPAHIRRILICNHYQHIHYSLQLVSAC